MWRIAMPKITVIIINNNNDVLHYACCFINAAFYTKCDICHTAHCTQFRAFAFALLDLRFVF